MLKKRIISTLIVLPIFLILLLQPSQFLFKLLWLAIIFLAAMEWSKLVHIALPNEYFYAAGISLLALIAANCHFIGNILIVLSALCWIFMVPGVLRDFSDQNKYLNKKYFQPCLGGLFLAGFMAAVVYNQRIFGAFGLLCLFVLIWASDIGAYFIGKRFGKLAFASTISPNKTFEGFLGGWIVSMILATVFAIFYKQVLVIFPFIVCSAFIFVFASFGDLLESVLKRRSGVKDSGTLLPGHGGILDRIDSWLPAMTLWAFAKMIGLF